MNTFSFQDSELFRQQAYLAGRWVDADNGTQFEVNNPATGEVLGRVPQMGATETRRAIEAAKAAWPEWRRKAAKDRGAILRKWSGLMLANTEDLAKLMTAEQGKPLAEAKGEIAYAASFLDWFAEEGKRTYGETVPAQQNDRRIVVLKEPIGVTCAITPWNFPAAMITRKAGPALAAGCPMILKPAEATPFSALALAVLAERAGVPPGIFSIVTGDPKAIGVEMTSNPEVRLLSFTGSTAVGRILMRQSADTIKKLALELGGNAPLLLGHEPVGDVRGRHRVVGGREDDLVETARAELGSAVAGAGFQAGHRGRRLPEDEDDRAPDLGAGTAG